MDQKESEIRVDGPYLFNHLNCIITYDDEQRICQIRCPISEIMLNPMGIVHGGITTYLADTAMAFLHVRYKDAPYVSLEIKTSYLKAATSGSLLATARYVKEGRQVIFAECTTENDKGEITSVSSGTFYRLDSTSPVR